LPTASPANLVTRLARVNQVWRNVTQLVLLAGLGRRRRSYRPPSPRRSRRTLWSGGRPDTSSDVVPPTTRAPLRDGAGGEDEPALHGRCLLRRPSANRAPPAGRRLPRPPRTPHRSSRSSPRTITSRGGTSEGPGS